MNCKIHWSMFVTWNLIYVTGCIKSIVVMGPSKWCGLVCSDFEYIIPFGCITQVGPDIILVSCGREGGQT